MSVKHLEYLKVNDSKLLVVEIRPVKCLLDTPSGPTHSDKWMEHSHWKELHHILKDIVDEYEEQRNTQSVKCNFPKCKSDETLQIGYMFRNLPSCYCSPYFLTPRSRCTWTQDDVDSSGNLQDKGGNFEDLVACGEMLVISVLLRDPADQSTDAVLSPSPSTTHQAHLNKKLIKALDSTIEYTNSISDYFTSCSASGKDGASARRRRKKRSPTRKKSITSSSCKEHKKKENDSRAVGKDLDSSHCNPIVKSSTHLDVTSANQDLQKEHIKEEKDYNFDAAQPFSENRAMEINSPNESLTIFEDFVEYSQLTFKKECCSNLIAEEMEHNKLCLYQVKNDKEVNVHGNSNNNSQTSDIEAEMNEKLMEIPSKNFACLTSDIDENYCEIEVKDEVYSDLESVLSTLCQDPGISQSGDTHRENAGYEPQPVSRWAPSTGCGSDEQSGRLSVLADVCLERVREENRGRNTRYISPVPVSQKSFITMPSTDPAQTDQILMTGEDDKVPGFSEHVNEDEIGMEAKEGGSLHRAYVRNTHQKGTIMNCKKIRMAQPSNSDCTVANVKYSSVNTACSFSGEDFEANTVESAHTSDVLKNLHSCIKEENDAPDKMHAQPQDLGDVMAPYPEECKVMHKEDSTLILSTSIKDEVPQKTCIETKIPQEYLSSKRLMSEVNNRPESSIERKENYSAGGYQENVSNSTNIKSDEGSLETTKSSNPSRKAQNSNEHIWQVTQPTRDQERHEDMVSSDSDCDIFRWRRVNYDDAKKKVTAQRNSTIKSETSPELECMPTSKSYVSKTKKSFLSAEDSVNAENEAVQSTQMYEHLPLSVEKNEHLLERKQQAQPEEVDGIYMWQEGSDVQDTSEIFHEFPDFDLQRIQRETKQCLSGERSLSQENRHVDSSKVNIDSCSTSESPQSTQDFTEVQSSLQKKTVEQSTTNGTEEPRQYVSKQKSVKKRKSLIDVLRSYRFDVMRRERVLDNERGENAERLASGTEACERSNAKEIKRRKQISNESEVDEVNDSVEVPDSVLPSSNENNRVQETDSDTNGYRYLDSSIDLFLDESSNDQSPAHHSNIVVSSSPKVSDASSDLPLENDKHEPQTNSLVPFRSHVVSKPKGLDVKSKTDARPHFSPSRRVKNTPVKRSLKCDSLTKLFGSFDESERNMEGRVSPLRDDEYVPESVPVRGKKKFKSNPPDPDYFPTRKTDLPQAKKKLFVAENSTSLVKASNHSAQDLLKKNSDYSPYTPSITKTSSSMPEGFLGFTSPDFPSPGFTSPGFTSPGFTSLGFTSPGFTSPGFTSPETNQSKEMEEMNNVRRSSRIRKNSYLYYIGNTDTSDSNGSDEEEHSSAETEKSRKSKSISPEKKERTNSVLKQTKISNYCVKTLSPDRRKNKTKKKSPDNRQPCDSPPTDETKKQEGVKKQHKCLKKKPKSPHKTTAKGIVTKPFSSKHEPTNKAQTNKKKPSLNDYNEIWNFRLPDHVKTRSSSSTTKQQKIARPKKNINAPAESVSKGKIDKTKGNKRHSNSNAENCAPNIIDEELYWSIQAETEKLVALANADDALGDKLSCGAKGKNSGKASGKGKKSQRKKSSDEECLILKETSKAFQKLQALRTSYKLLHNMTESDLEQRMDESLPYLKRVIQGVEPNERHEFFMASSRQLRMQQDYLIYGPFTADQAFHVLELLKEKLGHMDKFIGKINDVLVYRVRVLVPTFFTKIVMENESVSMAEAYRLMARFSLDRKIADDISSAESRKF